VALVGDRYVELEILQRFIDAATGMTWQTVNDRVASRLFDQFLDQEVVASAAERGGAGSIPVDPGPRSASVRLLVGDLCGPVPPLDERMVELELAARSDELRPARVYLRQMLIDDLEGARLARSRLDLGEPFEDVSSDVSRAANASEGGLLGYVAQGTLPPGLDDVVFSLSAGEVSDPVQSPSGYHIFQVLEVVPEGPAAPAELELSVRRELADDIDRDFVRRCVERTADEVGVVVFQDHLWFRYEGRYGGESHGS
jgi:parvulin-like peptidyl-prolyl isomerase